MATAVRLLFAAIFALFSINSVGNFVTGLMSGGGSAMERYVTVALPILVMERYVAVALPILVMAMAGAIFAEGFYRQFRLGILALAGVTFVPMAIVSLGAAWTAGVPNQWGLAVSWLLIPLAPGLLYLEWIRPRMHLNESFGATLKRLRQA